MRTSARATATAAEVQDAYALRCAPQVHGAVRDAAAHARRVLEIEMNAATDNPMVFAGIAPGEGELISGGNFHGAPVALVCDHLAAAAVDLASHLRAADGAAAQSVALVRSAGRSSSKKAGLNSGLMMIARHGRGARLRGEGERAPRRRSTRSRRRRERRTTSRWGRSRARKSARNVELLETVLAIEFLAAAQALDLRRPLRSSPLLEEAHGRLRAKVPFWSADRAAAPAIEGAREVLSTGLSDLFAPLS